MIKTPYMERLEKIRQILDNPTEMEFNLLLDNSFVLVKIPVDGMTPKEANTKLQDCANIVGKLGMDNVFVVPSDWETISVPNIIVKVKFNGSKES